MKSKREKLTRLFVYGTLLRDQPNHRWLAHAHFVGIARTTASFRMVSLGAFPGIIAEGCTSIVGELYDVNAETLAMLDHLEGHPQFYARVVIALEDGDRVHAYVLPAGRYRSHEPIASGDWRAFSQIEQQHAPQIKDEE